VIPVIGHSLIYLDFNCEASPTIMGQILLVLGLTFFGIGIGTYYSVSFPGVGMSVPKKIRGNIELMKEWLMLVWHFSRRYL
jgi:hypothetical protein